MKLIKMVNEVYNTSVIAGAHVGFIAEKMGMTQEQLTESINHVLVNVETDIMAGKGAKLSALGGNVGALAGFLAGLEYIVARGQISDSLAAYFSAVGMQGGTISHMGATSQIAQVGAERRGSRKAELAEMIEQAKQGDEKAATAVRNVASKLRVDLERAVRASRATQQVDTAPAFA